jgi:hypothetical protein
MRFRCSSDGRRGNRTVIGAQAPIGAIFLLLWWAVSGSLAAGRTLSPVFHPDTVRRPYNKKPPLGGLCEPVGTGSNHDAIYGNEMTKKSVAQIQFTIIPKSREKALAKLNNLHGMDYAITRNHQIQIGKAGRDFLKEFSTYVGSDGKASKSALDRKTGEARESGGNVHVAVTSKFNHILGGSVKDADLTGDTELLAKHILAWNKVKPVLQAGKDTTAPRKECFSALWNKVQEIGRI